MPVCTLCSSKHVRDYFSDSRLDQTYWICGDCDLVFLDPSHFLSRDEEKKRYQTHQNDSADKRYQDFLNRMVEPLKGHLKKGWVGLDYGCGPGPTVSKLLGEAGFSVVDYDPCFFNRPEVLKKHYDFVTSTEVVEHFHQPCKSWEQIFSLLKPHGLLGIMTEPRPELTEFDRWYYRRDPTHVSFYSISTLEYLAQRGRFQVKQVGRNAFLFLRD